MRKMHLVLLAGQSNMAGRGIPEPEDLMPVPGVYAFDSRVGSFVPSIEPVTFDHPRWNGVSCGRTFAKLLRDLDPGTPVGLIPAAVGATPLSSWKPGAKAVYTDHHPYDDCIALAERTRKYGEITAILWHQGESDAVRKNENYAADLTELVNNLRRDLDLPEVPFICGELGYFLKGTQYDFPAVTDGIRKVTETLPFMGLASAEGLNDKGDQLHFDTPSLRIFGERYFAEYCRLRGIENKK